jgi:ketosteroid isomerase-like protein
MAREASGAVQAAQQLVSAINVHDVDALAALLTPEHRFIDSLGTVVVGRDALREGWRQYFRLVPDYHIEVERVLGDGPHVVLLGSAHGTYTTDGTLEARNAWRTPGAWHALVHEGLIAEWQVYADNEPLRRCIRAAGEERHG